MSDKLSDLIQVRLNAIDRLGLNSIARRASAHVYGEWKERAEALEQRVEEAESERDMLRTVLDDTDKAELLEALEQSTKEALTLRERIEELETEGCGQCEACEDFFPLSLLNITDDGVALCSGDWNEVLEATAALAADDDLDKLTTQQKPTEEAMEEA